jgi:hypothetical protein
MSAQDWDAMLLIPVRDDAMNKMQFHVSTSLQ